MPIIKWRRGLYAITDTKRYSSEGLITACEQALQGGSVMLQYRDKSQNLSKRIEQATALRKLCHTYNTFLIIDNDIELCLQTDADGVHLGPLDLELTEARQLLGPGKIMGVSCHQDINKAHRAVTANANYVSFGAFYPSKTRPDADIIDFDILKELKNFPIPVVAIGGINLERAGLLIQNGVDHVAVISDLWNADNIEQHAKAYTQLFTGYSSVLDRGFAE